MQHPWAFLRLALSRRRASEASVWRMPCFVLLKRERAATILLGGVDPLIGTMTMLIML